MKTQIVYKTLYEQHVLFRKLYGLCFDKIVSIVNIRGAVKNRFPFIIRPCHQKLFVCMCVCALVSANVCVRVSMHMGLQTFVLLNVSSIPNWVLDRTKSLTPIPTPPKKNLPTPSIPSSCMPTSARTHYLLLISAFCVPCICLAQTLNLCPSSHFTFPTSWRT